MGQFGQERCEVGSAEGRPPSTVYIKQRYPGGYTFSPAHSLLEHADPQSMRSRENHIMMMAVMGYLRGSSRIAPAHTCIESPFVTEEGLL